MAARNQFGFTQEQELVRAQVNEGPTLRATFISLIPLSTVFLLLRFAARTIAKTPFWWDDWLAVIAWAAAVSLNAILITAVDQGGLGKHAEIAGLPAIVYGNKILYASEIIYQFSMTCIKLSMILFYYRIFKMSRYFNNALWVMSTVTLCWYWTSTFVIIFQCKPISYLWDQSTPGGQCIPQERLWIGSSVTSLLTDVAVLCLPMPMIWRLRATRNQKLALTAIFLLGAFVCITSIIRLTKINDLNIKDPSYSFVAPAIWTSVECSVAVISASLPTLKPLFRTLFDLTDVLPFDTHHVPRKSSDPPSSSNSALGFSFNFNGNGNGNSNNNNNSSNAPTTTPAIGSVAACPNMSHNPNPRIQNWRAQANAKRITELGEYRTDNAGHHFVNETGVWEEDEKRYIPGSRGYVDRHHHAGGNGAGAGRKFSVAGVGDTLKEKFSRGTLRTPKGKRSVETIGAAEEGERGGNAERRQQPQQQQQQYTGTTRPSTTPAAFGGGHPGLGIQVRSESPWLWNRAGERGSWKPVRLGGFEFEGEGGRKTPVTAAGARAGAKRGFQREESGDSEVTFADSKGEGEGGVAY